MFNLLGNKGGDDFDDDFMDITLGVDVEKPPGRDPPPFEPAEVGFTTNDPNIKMIEVNQGLSYGKNGFTGEFYLLENFAAGKETAIFVDLAKPPSPSSEMTLTVERDGQRVAVLLPCEMIDDSTVLFQPVDMIETDYWEEGAYTLTFDMDGSTAVRTVNLIRVQAFKILIMPIISNQGGRIDKCLGDWQDSVQMIIDAYPVAEADIDYVFGPEIDLSGPRFDMSTDEGPLEVWCALNDRQTPDDPYTLIIGFVKDEIVFSDGDVAGGYTYGYPVNIITEQAIDMLAVVIHEIAHCYFIGDEYPRGSLNDNLNPPPFGMKGKDLVTRQPAVGTRESVVGGFDVGLPGSGSVIYENQRPYRLRDHTLLYPVTSFMGFAGTGESYTKWITSDIWDHLFKSFTGKSSWGLNDGTGPDNEIFGVCPKCSFEITNPAYMVQCRECQTFTPMPEEKKQFPCKECRSEIDLNVYELREVVVYCPGCNSLIWYKAFGAYNSGDGKMGAEEEKVMVTKITGVIDPGGGFEPDPWYSYKAPQSLTTVNKDGEYAVCIYDGKGKKLSTTYFDAEQTFQSMKKDSWDFATDAKSPINIVVSLPADAAKIAIEKDGEEVYAREVSKEAPTVSFTGLAEGQDIGDKATLTWDASGEGELCSEIWYYPHEGEFYKIATDITGNSCDIDLSDCPGSDEGFFRILCTDGVNTAEAWSAHVKVPYMAPLILTDNKETLRFKATEEIFFRVNILDKQDGTMLGRYIFDEASQTWNPDTNVEWFIDGKPFYCYGDVLFAFPYKVPPGTYTATLVVKNSAGLETSKDFKLEIIDDDSDLPDDWSRDEIKDALLIGFSVPFDRIDAPINRGLYARFLGYIFTDFSNWPGGHPDIKDTDVPQYTGNDYDEAMMVWLGLMDVAADGSFDAHKSLTERDGAVNMMKILFIANDPSMAGGSFDEEALLQKLFDADILTDSGPDAFEPDKKLSNRLAMVRLDRLYHAIYSGSMFE
ncbi:MAG: hypothetical protein FWG03_06060 [Clostridiales bacterium]|nr:hypothetical protein [Clostridiales bacterium]